MASDPDGTGCIIMIAGVGMAAMFFFGLLVGDSSGYLYKFDGWQEVQLSEDYDCYEAPFHHVQRGSFYCIIKEPPHADD